MKSSVAVFFSVLILGAFFAGCSGTKNTQSSAPAAKGSKGDRDLALSHYLNGGMLDQKEDYAAAILEYQDALRYDQDPAIYYSIAKDYSIIGKPQLAIDHAREAIRLAPTNREYRETLAEIYLRSLQFDSARVQYEEIIKVDSSYRSAWFGAGRIIALSHPAEAAVFFQHYIDYFGDDFDIYTQLAQIYGTLGKTDKVIATLRQMSQMEPANAEVKKLLGDTYIQADSVDQALAIFQKLVGEDPDNIPFRGSLAYAYFLKKDKQHAQEQIENVMSRDSITADEQVQFGQVIVSLLAKDSTAAPMARDLFQSIRQSHPKDWRPYWFLGAIANLEHNDSTAVSYFREVTKLAGWNVDGWVALASIYYDNEQFEKAVAVLEEAKKIVPNEFRIYFILGVSQQRMKNDADAAASLEQAIQLNDKSVEALSALGLVYDEMSRHEDSDSMYERALRIDPKNALVLNNYSYSLSERAQQLKRALSMSEEAVRQAPDNQSYLDTKGWIFYQLGRYEEAELTIRRAVELGSKSPVIHEHLGDVYSKLHQKEKAVEYWQKAVQFGGDSPGLRDKIQRGSL